MFFSKSFGYALRGVLCIAVMNEDKERIQLNEMAGLLGVPRYFLGKVMNRLVKDGILDSVKGHNGGFSINKSTKRTTLLKLAECTGEMNQFDSCVLRFRSCNNNNPCPLHCKMAEIKDLWSEMLSKTTINDLLNNEIPDFIRSLTVEQ